VNLVNTHRALVVQTVAVAGAQVVMEAVVLQVLNDHPDHHHEMKKNNRTITCFVDTDRPAFTRSQASVISSSRVAWLVWQR